MHKRFVLFGLLVVAFAALTSPALASNTNCSGTLVGTYDDVTVQQNDSCTLTAAATITGNVSVKQNAYFEADGTSIAGDIKGDKALTIFTHDGASAKKVEARDTFQVYLFDSSFSDNVKIEKTTQVVNLCGNTVGKDVEVKKSGQDILIGDPFTIDCAGNSIGGNLKVEENNTDVELILRGNSVGKDMKVKKNTGPSDKAVEGNTVGETLECKENAPPFTAAGNTAAEFKGGQC